MDLVFKSIIPESVERMDIPKELYEKSFFEIQQAMEEIVTSETFLNF